MYKITWEFEEINPGRKVEGWQIEINRSHNPVEYFIRTIKVYIAEYNPELTTYVNYRSENKVGIGYVNGAVSGRIASMEW